MHYEQVALLILSCFLAGLRTTDAKFDSAYTIGAKLGLKGNCDNKLYQHLQTWGCNETDNRLDWDPRQGCVIQQFTCWLRDKEVWRFTLAMKCESVVLTTTQKGNSNDTTIPGSGVQTSTFQFNGAQSVNISLNLEDRLDAVYIKYNVTRLTVLYYDTGTVMNMSYIAASPWVQFTKAKVCLAFGNVVYIFAAFSAFVYISCFLAIRFSAWVHVTFKIRIPAPWADPEKYPKIKVGHSALAVKFNTVRDNLLGEHTVLSIFFVHHSDVDVFSERERFMLLLMTNLTNYWVAFLLQPPRSASRGIGEGFKHSIVVTLVVTACNIGVGQVVFKSMFKKGTLGWYKIARWTAYIGCALYIFASFAFTALEVLMFSFAPLEAAVVSVVQGWLVTEPVMATVRFLILRKFFGVHAAPANYGTGIQVKKAVLLEPRMTRERPPHNPLNPNRVHVQEKQPSPLPPPVAALPAFPSPVQQPTRPTPEQRTLPPPLLPNQPTRVTSPGFVGLGPAVTGTLIQLDDDENDLPKPVRSPVREVATVVTAEPQPPVTKPTEQLPVEKYTGTTVMLPGSAPSTPVCKGTLITFS